MTEVQRRVLIMCQLNFYEVSVEPTSFQRALRSLGWKAQPDFSKASTDALERLALGLRSKLRLGVI